MNPILLASQSPRRRELFAHLGYPFTCTSVDTDETPRTGEAPETLVRRLARDKAAAAHQGHPEAVTVGGDTVVTIDGEILGKPDDEAHARAMLSRLQGRDHVVWTGIAVIGPGNAERVEAVACRVWFRPMDSAEIAAYVATGEPMDKAGAYGIQERGATFVEKVEGDYFTVVGLPLCRLGMMLKAALGA